MPSDIGAIERVLADCGAEPADPVPAGDWISLTDESDALEGPRPVAVLTSFEHDLPVPFHRVPARLFVECAEPRPTVSLTRGGMTIAERPHGQVRVAHRFDTDDIIERNWEVSGGSRVIMLWYKTRDFLAGPQDHDRLVVRVRGPAGQVLGTVTFAGLAGAGEALRPVLDTCR